MTTSMSPRIEMLCMKFGILQQRYSHIYMLGLAYEKHLLDHIISIRGNMWNHETN